MSCCRTGRRKVGGIYVGQTIGLQAASDNVNALAEVSGVDFEQLIKRFIFVDCLVQATQVAAIHPLLLLVEKQLVLVLQ